MSDNFRVNNNTSESGAGGFKSGSKKGDSLAHFKRGRKKGDIVMGVFLALERSTPGTAWVNLEGDKLLAVLPEEWAALAKRIFAGKGVGARPTGVDERDFPLQPGDSCYFELKAIEPRPVLQMLGPDNSGKQAGLSLRV
ncbi:MAG: hypothetical protein LBV76_04525 [Deltaproteobacteria bacterium]|jgi:hypothetical protein|nr:hypothetical protein [Deltaproteobacteria bacterium]